MVIFSGILVTRPQFNLTILWVGYLSKMRCIVSTSFSAGQAEPSPQCNDGRLNNVPATNTGEGNKMEDFLKVLIMELGVIIGLLAAIFRRIK